MSYKKRILWLCNIVLPDFCEEFGIKQGRSGGWMTGMLNTVKKNRNYEFALCFPIIDEFRLKSGQANGCQYYSFQCNFQRVNYDFKMVSDFENILEDFRPDIVHIWGTEFPHSSAMVKACYNKNMEEKIVVNIQGLVSICADFCLLDIPPNKWKEKYKDKLSMFELMKSYENRGKLEKEVLKSVKHVIGRTDWDRACVEAINANVYYYYCNETLRDTFYLWIGKWKYESCKKHTIFFSQARSPIKGLHNLLIILPDIIKKFPNTHVYVGGTNILEEKNKNSYSVYIENLIKENRLENYITFLGFLSEIQMVEQYMNANVFVSASSMENESNSISEAKLIGVPVVASNVGGIINRITHGVDGYIYPYNERYMMQYYILQIFNNKDNICSKFSENASEKMKMMCCPEINAERNLSIYESIYRRNKLSDDEVELK